jgi:feruloyl esterase
MLSFSSWVTLALLATAKAAALADPCSALTSLKLENTTITNAFHQLAQTNIATPLSCYDVVGDFTVSTSICRVQGFINTTTESSLEFEAWLPDVWYGRFMGLGNSGLGGCEFVQLFSYHPLI